MVSTTYNIILECDGMGRYQHHAVNKLKGNGHGAANLLEPEAKSRVAKTEYKSTKYICFRAF
jgi:hypothetical protein